MFLKKVRFLCKASFTYARIVSIEPLGVGFLTCCGLVSQKCRQAFLGTIYCLRKEIEIKHTFESEKNFVARKRFPAKHCKTKNKAPGLHIDLTGYFETNSVCLKSTELPETGFTYFFFFWFPYR